MDIKLNAEEQDYLGRAIDRYLWELENEIAHTDAREFKQDLKSEAKVLYALRQKFSKDREQNWVHGMA